jgi:hypothetical protein
VRFFVAFFDARFADLVAVRLARPVDLAASFRLVAFRGAAFLAVALRVLRTAVLPAARAVDPAARVVDPATREVAVAARRPAAFVWPTALVVTARVCFAAVRVAERVWPAPRDAAVRIARVAVRARVTTGFAISAVTFTAVPAPRTVADATPCAAFVSVLAIASRPPAAVPKAAPTVSAAAINVLSSLLSSSSGKFSMFAPYRVCGASILAPNVLA